MASQDHWDSGSIPSPAQWVKDLALPHQQLRLQLRLRSDPLPGNSICCGRPKKKKKKMEEKKNKSPSISLCVSFSLHIPLSLSVSCLSLSHSLSTSLLWVAVVFCSALSEQTKLLSSKDKLSSSAALFSLTGERIINQTIIDCSKSPIQHALSVLGPLFPFSSKLG